MQLLSWLKLQLQVSFKSRSGKGNIKIKFSLHLHTETLSCCVVFFLFYFFVTSFSIEHVFYKRRREKDHVADDADGICKHDISFIIWMGLHSRLWSLVSSLKGAIKVRNYLFFFKFLQIQLMFLRVNSSILYL